MQSPSKPEPAPGVARNVGLGFGVRSPPISSFSYNLSVHLSRYYLSPMSPCHPRERGSGSYRGSSICIVARSLLTQAWPGKQPRLSVAMDPRSASPRMPWNKKNPRGCKRLHRGAFVAALNRPAVSAFRRNRGYVDLDRSEMKSRKSPRRIGPPSVESGDSPFPASGQRLRDTCAGVPGGVTPTRNRLA